MVRGRSPVRHERHCGTRPSARRPTNFLGKFFGSLDSIWRELYLRQIESLLSGTEPRCSLYTRPTPPFVLITCQRSGHYLAERARPGASKTAESNPGGIGLFINNNAMHDNTTTYCTANNNEIMQSGGEPRLPPGLWPGALGIIAVDPTPDLIPF